MIWVSSSSCTSRLRSSCSRILACRCSSPVMPAPFSTGSSPGCHPSQEGPLPPGTAGSSPGPAGLPPPAYGSERRLPAGNKVPAPPRQYPGSPSHRGSPAGSAGPAPSTPLPGCSSYLPA